jgi:hypothetical protein
MKKLPIGLQTFSKLIHGNYVYVDKTRAIFDLIQSGQYFFISRPRRFGKSLLVSTLSEIFSGNQALFQGLYIHDKIDWQPHPVIHIDLSAISYDNAEVLKQSLSAYLDGIGQDVGIALSRAFLKDRFFELIKKLAATTQAKVVVLIDEYDKPIIDHVDQQQRAGDNREVLKDFYGVLKSADRYLQKNPRTTA